MTGSPASHASTRRLVVADTVHRPSDAWDLWLDTRCLAALFGHGGNALCR